MKLKKCVLPSSNRRFGAQTQPSTIRPTIDHASLAVAKLDGYVEAWLSDCEIDSCSPNTIDNRRIFLRKLKWFLSENEHDAVGEYEMKLFFVYLKRGHGETGGRWGIGADVRSCKNAPKPSTISTYWRNIHAFFAWCVDQSVVTTNPMVKERVKGSRGECRDEVQPFTDEQVSALKDAARLTSQPERDYAIIHLLCDTGIRASELSGVNMGDIDVIGRQVSVRGKGDKARAITFGRKTKAALLAYMRTASKEYEPSPDEPFFVATRGPYTNERLSRKGLLYMLIRLGKAAGITGVRCSPHTCRHYFAVKFLRRGGDGFALMKILGHTDFEQTRIYVQYAQADIHRQGSKFSPMDDVK